MKQRSFFWPLLLIATGVVWLLVSLNIIPAGNLWALPHLVPYMLMAFGIGLLVHWRWPAVGSVISALVVVGAVLAIIFAAPLGWSRPTAWNLGGNFWAPVAGSGNMSTETRELASFDSITLSYPATVTIEQGDEESITIEAEDNVLPQIATEVESGRLKIESREVDWDARVNPSRTIKITIIVKDLHEIALSAAGTVRVNDLETDSLKLVLSGAGELDLRGVEVGSLDTILSGAGSILAEGKADSLKVLISGFGSFKGEDLETLSTEVRISGSGDAAVNVKEDLKATITGAGSVNYFGSPTVEQTISGAGSVKPAK
jgi:hypothetical protein